MGIFSGLALKFPLVRRAFRNVKAAWEQQTASVNTTVSPSELGVLLQAMGAHDLTDNDIQELFKLSDLDGSKSISFREFLIAIAIGYYLRDLDPSKERSPNFQENQRGFKVIRDAFQKIDADHGGTVDPLELKQALFDVAEGEEDNEILEARFKELDFDGSTDITFPEFLYGFANWVGVTEGEDDGDDPLAEANSASNAAMDAEAVADCNADANRGKGLGVAASASASASASVSASSRSERSDQEADDGHACTHSGAQHSPPHSPAATTTALPQPRSQPQQQADVSAAEEKRE